MFVKDYMTRHPIMIEPDKRVIEAQKIMAENKVRHLPVVGDGKRLIGLVTRSRLQIAPDKLASLDVWEITRLLASLKVKDVMVKGPDLHYVSPDATLEEAADLMNRHKVGGLPVVEEGVVLGIITETDLLVELQNLLGAYENGWRVTMRVPDRSGEFSRITNVIFEHGWGIMAMGSVRSPKSPNHWDIVLKVSGAPNMDDITKALNTLEGQQVIDVCEAKAYPP